MLMIALAEISQSPHRQFMADLFERWQRLMYFAARHYLGSYLSQVDDVVGDTLLSLLEKVDHLQEMNQEEIPYYIIAVVRSKVMDMFRRKQRIEEFFTIAKEDDIASIPDGEDVEGQVLVREMARWVKKKLSEFPVKERIAFRLKVWERWKDADIAQALDISQASVRKYVSRVRERLRAARKAEGLEEGEDTP